MNEPTVLLYGQEINLNPVKESTFCHFSITVSNISLSKEALTMCTTHGKPGRGGHVQVRASKNMQRRVRGWEHPQRHSAQCGFLEHSPSPTHPHLQLGPGHERSLITSPLLSPLVTILPNMQT